MQTTIKDDEAAEIKEAAKKTGLRIHSVVNVDHWRLPLSSSDPRPFRTASGHGDVVAQCRAVADTALVPASSMQTSYRGA
jgi:hypothetical protein